MFGCDFDDACLKPLKSCLPGVIPRFDAIVACWVIMEVDELEMDELEMDALSEVKLVRRKSFAKTCISASFNGR